VRVTLFVPCALAVGRVQHRSLRSCSRQGEPIQLAVFGVNYGEVGDLDTTVFGVAGNANMDPLWPVHSGSSASVRGSF